MSRENVEVVRRVWDLYMEGAAGGRTGAEITASVFDAGLVAADATFTPVDQMPGEGETYVGAEGFMEFLRGWTEVWTDWTIRPERFIDAGDDRVVVIIRQAAKGKGSGVAVDIHFAAVYTLVDGQVVDRRDYLDPADAYEAVGVRE